MTCVVRSLSLALGLVLTAGLASAQADTGAIQDAIVRSIEVQGNERHSDDQIIQALGIHVGEPLDAESLDREGIRVLFELFHVRVRIEKRAADGGGLDVRLIIQELPVDLEPRFVGQVEITTEDLLEWAELGDRAELYLYQAPRIRRRLLRHYLEEGFYFAEVNIVDRPGGVDSETGIETAPDVIFEIKEGPKVRVRDVVFTGNESIPDERFLLFFRRGLRKLAEVELRKPRLFGLFPKAFVHATLDADIIAMREVYRDFGFLNAIVELERLEFSDDREWVTIHVAIDEGGRYRIGSISLEGVEYTLNAEGTNLEERPAELLFSERQLLDKLKIRVGETYERRLHADDERALRRFYGSKGYIDHRSLGAANRWRLLPAQLTFEEDAAVVHISYRIAQGRQIFVREVSIVGNVHTQDRIIRDLITFEPGDVADPEEIERSRARITATGFFSDQFDITHVEPDYRYIDTDDANWKDIEFTIEEGQVLTFTLAGGVSSNTGAFGTIGLSMRNFDATNMPDSFGSLVEDVASRQAFHGAGQELRLRASPGTDVSYYDVLFSDPDIFHRHRDRISGSINAQKRVRLYRSHDEERNEVGFRIGRALSIDSQVFTGFRTGTVEIDDIDASGAPSLGNPLTVPELLKQQEGLHDLAHVLFGYRYEEIDNRLSPRNGFRFVFENRLYSEALGSDFEFVKSDLRFDWWNEFDDDPTVVSPYFHFQLGLGVASPFGDTDDVPYSERYFLGGLSTLRGYRFRGVGPNENGYPIGGETMFHGTVEYRYPLVKQVQPGTYREYESIQMGTFVDVGILDPDNFSLDTSELRATVGFLFGIRVPLPITFSFGWPLLDGDGDEERVFGFNIGT